MTQENSQLVLKKVSARDAALIAKFGSETFRETYLGLMENKHLEDYIKASFCISVMEDYLSSPEIHAYQAMVEGELAAYSFLRVPSPPPAPLPPQGFGELGRLYVKKSFQGRGVGQALMAKQFEIAKELNFTGIWLSVWERNLNAIRFYENAGFQKSSQQLFAVGQDPQTDLILWKSS